jgi:hypothetical protein
VPSLLAFMLWVCLFLQFLCVSHISKVFWPSRLGTDYTVPWFLWYSLLLCWLCNSLPEGVHLHNHSFMLLKPTSHLFGSSMLFLWRSGHRFIWAMFGCNSSLNLVLQLCLKCELGFALCSFNFRCLSYRENNRHFAQIGASTKTFLCVCSCLNHNQLALG